MTSALVNSGSVVQFFANEIPNPLQLPSGEVVLAPSVGYVSASGYSILPAAMDTPPGPTSYPSNAPQTYAISNGTVHVTRTWITPMPPSPYPNSVQINSVSAPVLNGPYSITPQSINTYSQLARQSQSSNAFPNGASSFVINDANGIPHSFTLSTFMAFYNAVIYYTEALALGQAVHTPLTIA